MDRNFRKIQGLGNHIRQWDNQTLCGLFWLLAQRSGTMCHEGWLQPHGSLNLENVAGGHIFNCEEILVCGLDYAAECFEGY